MSKPCHDVVIVGGGPAGMAAAVSASGARLRVLLVDDNPGLGGQIWRGEERKPTTPEASLWRQKLADANVEVLRGARVFDAPEPGVLLAETNSGLHAIRYWRLILATGARERFLPFPGWTLPNVMGAGGLQAMVKSGMPIEGKRVVVAGTGPLLLAVASYMRAHGAKLEAVAEQAPMSRLMRFSASLLRMPGKIFQAASLRRQLGGAPYLTNCWPVAASGTDQLESVTLRHGNSPREIACDYLACGFHLIPNVELAVLLGCRLRDSFVAVDELQQTTLPDVYCAGEPTGIGGVELAVVEGQIAGYAAAGRTTDAWRLVATQRRLAGFARSMERAFALRPELREVAGDTLLCRCEDVAINRASRHQSWREAKLHTRCGMGPCQGRICGGAASFLFGWETESVRPPIFPASVGHLAAVPHGSEGTRPAVSPSILSQ